MRTFLDCEIALRSVSRNFDDSVIPTLENYIRIPNLSPAFNGGLSDEPETGAVIELLTSWVSKQEVRGLTWTIRRISGRTPIIYIEILASADYPDKEDTVLLYGHLDKQPPFEGWGDGLGPYIPVIRDGRLYGRGGADDGYAIFGAIEAVKALQEQQVDHAKYIILIEACEESGSPDLPAHLAQLIDDNLLKNVSLIVCLDSGCGSYDSFWMTTSLRGLLLTKMTVSTLSEGVHSGNGGGICADSFRIVRQLLSSIEDEATGQMISDFQVEIPENRLKQNAHTCNVLGDDVWRGFPLVNNCPMNNSCGNCELALNRGWRANLTVTGIDGVPSCFDGGNVLRPSTTVKLSIRLPPTYDDKIAFEKLNFHMRRVDIPHARIEFSKPMTAKGWNAPNFEPWLENACHSASVQLFGKGPCYIFEGGSIPFLGMLNDLFPAAQLYVFYFMHTLFF